MTLLFLTARFPWPTHKGDMLRAYHQVRCLHQRGHRIHLLSLADTPPQPADLDAIAPWCDRIDVVCPPRWRRLLRAGLGLASRLPLQVCHHQVAEIRRRLRLRLSETRYDALHVSLLRMLPYVWHLASPPVVVDLIDSMALNLDARRAQVRGPRRWLYELEYRRVLRYEHAATRWFASLVVVSPADALALVPSPGDSLTPPSSAARISVLPNGVDLDGFPFHDAPRNPRDPATIIFTGNMGYHPNEEAVLWFLRHVWPQLHTAKPDLRFHIAGAAPSARLLAAVAAAPIGVHALGTVPHMARPLSNATVAVCPMVSGSGIQNKVLEALAVGTPVVATSIANRGVQATHDRDLLVADSPADFASATLALLDDPDRRARLARAGRAFVETHFRWEEHARHLEGIYASCQAPLVPRAACPPVPPVALATGN